MTMTQEEHKHGILVILWPFQGNSIVMLLSHHICYIHLIVLARSTHSHQTYMVTYMLSWSSRGHATSVM